MLSACGDSIVDEWMLDSGLVRNRLKLEGVLKNARAYMKVKDEFGSFDKYIWGFVGGSPILNEWYTQSQYSVKSKKYSVKSKKYSVISKKYSVISKKQSVKWSQ